MVRPRLSRSLPSSILLALVLLLVPVGQTSPGDHDVSDEAFGARAGDPRVWADGAPCHELANATGGVTCSVLYGHIFNLLNRVPINVQHPPEWYGSVNRGIPNAPGVEHIETYAGYNEMVLYSSPGFVEYGDPDEDPYLHPERGITKSITVSKDVPITGYWYLSADFDELFGVDSVPSDGSGPDVGVMPCVTVRMTLETTQYAGFGDILAVGETTKTLVNAHAAGAGQDEPLLPEVPCPGSRAGDVVYPENVTEFQVELVPVADDLVIPKRDGYHVHVEWFQFAPSGDHTAEDKIVQSQWNVRTGGDALARVVLPIEEPLYIDRLVALPFNDQIYVQAEINSPWGSYDFDPTSVRMDVLDASGQPFPLEPPVLRYGTGHGSHFKAVAATWNFDHETLLPGPGDYTLRAYVKNWQHTATITRDIPFTWEDKGTIVVPEDPDAPPAEPAGPGDDKKVPGVGFGAVFGLGAAALIAVAVVRGRRTP